MVLCSEHLETLEKMIYLEEMGECGAGPDHFLQFARLPVQSECTLPLTLGRFCSSTWDPNAHGMGHSESMSPSFLPKLFMSEMFPHTEALTHAVGKNMGKTIESRVSIRISVSTA